MMETSSRRIFLGACLGGVAAAAAGAAVYPVFRYLAPKAGTGTRRKVEIPATELPEGAARFFEFEGKSAVLVRLNGGALVALSAVCTHLGCVVQWQKDKEQFLCPCHGGRFGADGAVLSGPPPKPLARLPLTVSGQTIVIG